MATTENKQLKQVAFTSIPLEQDMAGTKKKVPKKILHFSDGILEEYSSSEDDETDVVEAPVVDPKTLKWMPWCLFYAMTFVHKSYSVADFCGEKLAWFFGITTPKYRYALEEYKRTQKEIEEEKLSERKHQDLQSVSAVDIQIVDAANPLNSKKDMYKNEEVGKY